MYQKLLYLSRQDIEQIDLPIADIIEALDEIFKVKGLGQTDMPPKLSIHPRNNAFLAAMPAYISSSDAAGIKWVSAYADNFEKKLPYINGLLILNHADTGVPYSVMDCTWITAKRTGAATAVAARYLARPESSALGILACGVQGRSNFEALNAIFEIQTVRAYDLYPVASRRFAEDISAKHGVQVDIVNTPEAAVRDMDLVVTSGPILKNPTPSIEAGWMKEGAFACALDLDSYWTGGAQEEVDKIVTDDLEQLADHRNQGYFQETPHPYADLGLIAAGEKPGRETDRERILCMNLGLAIGDMATAVLVHRRAEERGIGTTLPL